MTPEEILERWQAVHGPLSSSHRAAFLLRREVGQLALMPDEHVQGAIATKKRLKAILEDVQRRIRVENKRYEQERLQAERARRVEDLRRRAPLPKVKFVCLECGREFVDVRRRDIACRRCRGGSRVHPVCRGCGRPGDWLWGGRCERCYDAGTVAGEAAGPGARGPSGIDVRDPDRRKRRWSGQSVEGPKG